MWNPEIQERKIFQGERDELCQMLRRGQVRCRLNLDHFVCQYGGHCVLGKSIFAGYWGKIQTGVGSGENENIGNSFSEYR